MKEKIENRTIVCLCSACASFFFDSKLVLTKYCCEASEGLWSSCPMPRLNCNQTRQFLPVSLGLFYQVLTWFLLKLWNVTFWSHPLFFCCLCFSKRSTTLFASQMQILLLDMRVTCSFGATHVHEVFIILGNIIKVAAAEFFFESKLGIVLSYQM